MSHFLEYFIIIFVIVCVSGEQSSEYKIVQENSNEKVSEFFVCLYDENEFERFNSQIIKLQRTLEDQKEAFKNVSKAANEKQNKNVESFQSTIQRQINVLKNFNSSIHTKLQSSNNQHSEDLRKIIIKIEELAAMTKSDSENLKNVQREIEQFKTTNNPHNVDLTKVHSSLENLSKEIKLLNGQNSKKLNGVYSFIKTLNEQHEITNKQHNETLENIHLSLQKLNKDLLDLKGLISTFSEERAESIQNQYTKQQNMQNQPTNCNEAVERNHSSGVYDLFSHLTNEKSYSAYCSESNDSNGAWTVIQRRQDGSVDFNRDWSEYKTGFGNLNGEYWLGLEHIHRLTSEKRHELLINVNENGRWLTYYYDSFVVGDEANGYPLLKLGVYKGDPHEFLSSSLTLKFSTKDKDHDWLQYYNCAEISKSGWWFEYCNWNLNGVYTRIGLAAKCSYDRYTDCYWKSTLMLIRPFRH